MTFPSPGEAGPYTGGSGAPAAHAVPGGPGGPGEGGRPDLARARGAAQLVIVWLAISVVWLAVSWLYWTLAGSLSTAEDRNGSLGDGTQRLLLIEAVGAVVTWAGVGALLPAVRRGVSAARVTLASLMLGLALAHLLTVLVAAGMLLLSTLVGFFVVIGGDADTIFNVVLAAVAAIALDGALVVLAIVAAVKLFRAGPRSPQTYAPPPPATYPPGTPTPGVDRYGPPA